MQNFQVSKNQAWDNVQFFKQNSEKDYCDTIQNIIKSDPFMGNKFYIFSFIKRVDDSTGVKKMYHQPRLTKPDPLPGTTLLRADPRDPDTITIIWTLPNQENFKLYSHGKFFANDFVHDCVQKYLYTPHEFMKPEEGDLTDEQIKDVYKSIRKRAA